MRRTAATSDHNCTPPSPANSGDTANPAVDIDPAAFDCDLATCSDAELAGLVDRAATLLSDAGRLERLSDDGVRGRVALLRRLEGQVAVAMAAAVHTLGMRGATRADGACSTSAWVRTHTGRSARAAARLVRRSSSLGELPATTAALAAGQVSTEAADAIVHAARDGQLGTPDQVETALLPVAVADGPEQVRAQIRRRTQQADGDSMLADERRQHARRKVSITRRTDGMWQLYGLLGSEAGNQLRTLLDIFDTPDPHDTPDGHRRRPDQRLADALHDAVEVALACGDLPTTGGTSRPHVAVIVDIDTFDTDLTDPDRPDRPVPPDDPVWADLPGAATAWSTTLSPQAARRICCDAGISRVVTTGPCQILDVGRQTRQWSPAQRRAIHVRDRSCRGPGCQRPIGWTHIHHLQWWRHGGPTNIDNGLALCPACHRLIHDLGWHAELDVATAAVTWTCPDQRRTVVTHPRQPA